METTSSPPNITNNSSKVLLDLSKNEKEDSQGMAPLESFEEFLAIEKQQKETEEEGGEDGIFLFPRFGDFNDDHRKPEDDSQLKDGIQLSTRLGEFDGGFAGGAGGAQPFMKSGFGGRPYPDSLFSFPVANEARSEFGGVNPESIPDVNIYQHKKTVAQGMMDLALFSANANQLRYVLESNNHPYFWPGVLLIGFSLILQVVIGCGLLMNTRYNVKDKKEICVANRINNLTIVGIFLVTVINVFICAFGVASGAPAAVFIGPRSGDEGFDALNDTNTE